MANFVAFRFTDNDFHSPLREAIEHLVKSHSALGLTKIPMLENMACRGLFAFTILRDVALNRSIRAAEEDAKLQEYFAKYLKVSFVNRLDELDGGFEGYVVDVHTNSVFYHGY